MADRLVCKGPGLEFTSFRNAGEWHDLPSLIIGKTESKSRPCDDLQRSAAASAEPLLSVEVSERRDPRVNKRQRKNAKGQATCRRS
jgi:hypothetical protein